MRKFPVQRSFNSRMAATPKYVDRKKASATLSLTDQFRILLRNAKTVTDIELMLSSMKCSKKVASKIMTLATKRIKELQNV